ncbi:Major facilitator superfamily domain general substrate transporter [Penicillium malachiteum]|uniref:Major facilitator superfamily domain general substrate transporter n=1 Tax=Penicillium malachiteum TaxID=1324776 RepID=UPI002547C188|nr:Major facilitator superfamily domain general substrate transporter [Penicillium malachiteum]KAJ5713504.1 Major facilitator superfamily domain general substrate transporter [Penicillium malachiteum]
MATDSDSSGPNSLRDVEKLSLSDTSPVSPAPEKQRHITGFRKIVNQFNAVEDLPWLSVGFVIGGMAMILPFGKPYVLFDAKWVFIVCTIMFMAGSAICGGAPNVNAEIVGCVMAGEGENGMYFGLMALISMNTTTKERPKYLSLRQVHFYQADEQMRVLTI